MNRSERVRDDEDDRERAKERERENSRHVSSYNHSHPSQSSGTLPSGSSHRQQAGSGYYRLAVDHVQCGSARSVYFGRFRPNSDDLQSLPRPGATHPNQSQEAAGQGNETGGPGNYPAVSNYQVVSRAL